MLSLIKTDLCLCFRWCPWNWSLVEYPQEGHPILWEIHGPAKMLLLWLQVMSPFCFLLCSGILLHSTHWGSLTSLFLYLLSLRDELPEAAYMHQLLGLNLLFLLSQNRVSEFHTELERLSARDIQTNVYIRHPVSLEQVWQFTPRQYYIHIALLFCCDQVQFWHLCIQLAICTLISIFLHYCCSRNWLWVIQSIREKHPEVYWQATSCVLVQ